MLQSVAVIIRPIGNGKQKISQFAPLTKRLVWPYPLPMPKHRRGGALLNISQLADALGYDRRTIYGRLKAGTCPVEPVPGMRPAKFRTVDVEALIGRPIDGTR